MFSVFIGAVSEFELETTLSRPIIAIASPPSRLTQRIFSLEPLIMLTRMKPLAVGLLILADYSDSFRGLKPTAAP